MAALPLLRRFGATVALRASAYVYSTRGDIDRLVDALQDISK
jgi:selenocysteine lyase/cysteine desulfurase